MHPLGFGDRIRFEKTSGFAENFFELVGRGRGGVAAPLEEAGDFGAVGDVRRGAWSRELGGASREPGTGNLAWGAGEVSLEFDHSFGGEGSGDRSAGEEEASAAGEPGVDGGKEVAEGDGGGVEQIFEGQGVEVGDESLDLADEGGVFVAGVAGEGRVGAMGGAVFVAAFRDAAALAGVVVEMNALGEHDVSLYW